MRVMISDGVIEASVAMPTSQQELNEPLPFNLQSQSRRLHTNIKGGSLLAFPTLAR